MHVAIANRVSAEKASSLIRTPHAIISITDPDKNFADFGPNENRVDILSLQFYDLEDIRDEMSPQDGAVYAEMFGSGLFSDQQAFQIVEFVERIKDKVNGFLIHCEAGVSRSAAVAAAIELMVNGSSDRVFQDKRYSPNGYVYRKLLEVWRDFREG